MRIAGMRVHAVHAWSASNWFQHAAASGSPLECGERGAAPGATASSRLATASQLSTMYTQLMTMMNDCTSADTTSANTSSACRSVAGSCNASVPCRMKPSHCITCTRRF